MIAEKDWVTIKRYTTQQNAEADALCSAASIAYSNKLVSAADACERAEVLAIYKDKSLRIMLSSGHCAVDLGWVEPSPNYKEGDKVRIKKLDPLYTLHSASAYPSSTLALRNHIVVLENGKKDKWMVADGHVWIKHCWIEGYADAPLKGAPSISVCSCNLSLGCSCGVFKREMVAAGKVYDSNLRCYVVAK